MNFKVRGDAVWNSECGVRSGIDKAWSMAHRAQCITTGVRGQGSG
jgi:hypothetical protein